MQIFLLAIMTGVATGWLAPHVLAIGLTSVIVLTTGVFLAPGSGVWAVIGAIGAVVLHQSGFLLGTVLAPRRRAAGRGGRDNETIELEREVAVAARKLSKTAARMRRADVLAEPEKRRARG